MIYPVSKQNESAVIDGLKGRDGELNSSGRKAANSLITALADRACQLRKKGFSIPDIADSMHLSSEQITDWVTASDQTEEVEPTQKLASTENPQETNYLSDAEKAYQEMYGQRWAAQGMQSPPEKVSGDISQGHRVLGAQAGNISDISGPQTQMGMLSHPSIWDLDVVERRAAAMKEVEDLRDTDKKAEAKRRENNRILSHDAYNKLAQREVPEDYEPQRGTAISKLADLGDVGDSYSRRLPPNALSIFDSEKFERMAEKTPGEQVKQAAKAKDRSWENQDQNVSTTKISSRMIDSLLDEGTEGEEIQKTQNRLPINATSVFDGKEFQKIAKRLAAKK